MRRYWPLAIVLGLTQPSHAAEVQVRLNGGLVEIQATAAPLQDVLARLAQQTGMKVVYDGPPPRTLVTLTLAGRTPPEAVLSLFEGLGVNYAMMQDRTGLRVDMLLVTGVSSSSSGSSSPSGRAGGAAAAPQVPPPEQRGRPQRPPVSEADADDEQEEDPNRPSPPPRGPGGAGGPGQGGPGQLVSPFGGQIQPLTMPTPPPPAGTPPSPTPGPTPSPGRL